MNWCICLLFCFNRQSLLRERFSIFLRLSHEGYRSTDMVTHVLNFFSHNWTVPDHLLCLKTVSRGCRACTRLSSPCFWLRHVMCHILPVGRSARFCFGCRTEVVAGLLCFRLCFHPTAGDCEALLCVGTWGFQQATPARVAGCVTPLRRCSCFWGCWRVVTAPLWVREGHVPHLSGTISPARTVYLQWELAVWVTDGEGGVSRCCLQSYREHQPSHWL